VEITEKMKNHRWSPHILVRYILLQLPGIILLVIVLMLVQENHPDYGWLIRTILILWVIKEIILYPFVWRSYNPESLNKNDPLVGLTGIVTRKLDPSGLVKVRGELWRAESNEKEVVIEPGEYVVVEGIRGLKLLVRKRTVFPLSSDSD
jgi:membrane protein implicated in regulation of membrane protease activity